MNGKFHRPAEEKSATSQETKELDETSIRNVQVNDLKACLKDFKLGTVSFKEYKASTYQEEEALLAEELKENRGEKDVEQQRAPDATPVYFYHPDHLGSSTFLTDANGIAYQFFLNLPFGETMAQQLPDSYYRTPFKFNGKELDEETGLYYYGARYYDPKISIWLSVDPLAESFPDWNPYNYTMQNPINLVDPTGMSSEDPDNGYKGIWNSETKKYDYTQVSDIGGNKTDVVSYYGGHLDGQMIGFIVSVERVYYNDMHSNLPQTYESKRSPGYQQLLKNTFAGHGIQPVGGLFDIFGFKEVGGIALAEASGSSYAPLALAILSKGKASASLGAAGGRGLWTLTKGGSSAIKNHKTFGTIYKSSSDGLWWAVDKAGHGGSKFKVFKEGKGGLEWFKDADEFGNFIINKHKGSTGTLIPWGQLSTVK